MTTKPETLSRRHFLSRTAKLTIVGAALPWAKPVLAALPSPSVILPETRTLAFDHTHTRERISLVYASNRQYLPESLDTLNHFLRDHYSGEVGRMDPEIFDLLYRIKSALGCEQPFHIISGYRCPVTNSRLRNTRGGGVAQRSLHMDGKAVDIRLPGVALKDLRDAALSLRAGGVGFYPSGQFVHIDTGRLRSWQG